MTYSPPAKEFIAAASKPEYIQPKTIDGYISRYKTQIEFGYDSAGYCQGLIDLLEELKRLRGSESRISNALTLMEDWDGVQFDQIRDVLGASDVL